MERGSNKHSPRLDEQMEQAVQGMMKAERPTHAEEWKEAEPAGEDQPDPGRLGEPAARQPAPPPGMSNDEVDLRSRLAAHLKPRSTFPADVSGLLDAMADTNAPDNLVQLVRQLPTGVVYEGLPDVLSALGLHEEDHRF
jgi:hypothetical protein